MNFQTETGAEILIICMIHTNAVCEILIYSLTSNVLQNIEMAGEVKGEH